MMTAPIGVFDSGYGGLTVLKEIKSRLPEYDFIYLGDNARAPYGSRSFETVYEYTLEAVKWLFAKGCRLVVLACNTASAKALRTIQQKYLPASAPENRVLGVIRPTAEVIGVYSKSRKIGILGTRGTVMSESYPIEIKKFFPLVEVYQHACPMWVPLVENHEYDGPGADYFIKKDLDLLLNGQSGIDTILLACTHYPLLIDKIGQFLPQHVRVVAQGKIVADSLADYLRRHPEIADRCSRTGALAFYTTDSTDDFDQHSKVFYGTGVHALHADL